MCPDSIYADLDKTYPRRSVSWNQLSLPNYRWIIERGQYFIPSAPKRRTVPCSLLGGNPPVPCSVMFFPFGEVFE